VVNSVKLSSSLISVARHRASSLFQKCSGHRCFIYPFVLKALDKNWAVDSSLISIEHNMNIRNRFYLCRRFLSLRFGRRLPALKRQASRLQRKIKKHRSVMPALTRHFSAGFCPARCTRFMRTSGTRFLRPLLRRCSRFVPYASRVSFCGYARISPRINAVSFPRKVCSTSAWIRTGFCS
jgi:hypothetical protein